MVQLYPWGMNTGSYPKPSEPLLFPAISPSITPSKIFVSPLIISATTVLKRAALEILPSFASMAASSESSFSIFASLPLSGPAYLAVYTPGAPPRASTSSPVSSAKQFFPNLFHRYSAFCTAFFTRVSPSSGISSVKPNSFGIISVKESPSAFCASTTLCWLPVAKIISIINVLIFCQRY